MRAVADRLAGLILLEPDVFRDERGFLLETHNRSRYAEFGIADDFVQDNHSRSTRGTIRGLHFTDEPGQAKLVRVSHGAVWDVVVDLRRTSGTFGEWESFELDDVDHRQLYVPIGFAHGFCVLSEAADVTYKMSTYYDRHRDRGLSWDDPQLGIEWPISDPLLSARDRANPRLAQLRASLPDW